MSFNFVFVISKQARVTPFINIFIVSSVSMCVSFLVLPSLYNKDEEAEISRKMEGNIYMYVCMYICV